MFRARLVASERTNVSDEIAELRRRAAAKRLSGPQLDEMTAQVGEALTTFVERGRALASGGSQMTVDRSIDGCGYSVRIHFETGRRGGGGFFASLRRALGL
jgi:hypothetical protein